ncbi:MAG: Hsp20/alpha crystallin family protein, partial [Hymenobacter sp.]
PVNIESTADSFVLTLFAAGLSKEKIQLSVQGEVLTIAYPGTMPAADSSRYTHQEFQDLGFERTFQLNGKVLAERINASYADGILTVTLPKDPAATPPAQTIAVG